MVKVTKLGLMALLTKEIIKMEKNTGKDFLNGKMDPLMKENFLKIILMVMVNMSGQTKEYLQANGKIIKWKVLVYSNGQTVDFTKENIKTIKKVETEYILGLMEENMMETG